MDGRVSARVRRAAAKDGIPIAMSADVVVIMGMALALDEDGSLTALSELMRWWSLSPWAWV